MKTCTAGEAIFLAREAPAFAGEQRCCVRQTIFLTNVAGAFFGEPIFFVKLAGAYAMDQLLSGADMIGSVGELH